MKTRLPDSPSPGAKSCGRESCDPNVNFCTIRIGWSRSRADRLLASEEARRTEGNLLGRVGDMGPSRCSTPSSQHLGTPAWFAGIPMFTPGLATRSFSRPRTAGRNRTAGSVRLGTEAQRSQLLGQRGRLSAGTHSYRALGSATAWSLRLLAIRASREWLCQDLMTSLWVKCFRVFGQTSPAARSVLANNNSNTSKRVAYSRVKACLDL